MIANRDVALLLLPKSRVNWISLPEIIIEVVNTLVRKMLSMIEKDELDYVRDAELQKTKAGARIGMDAAANSDRYGAGKQKDSFKELL